MVDVRLTTQTPRCVFTQGRRRLSIFFGLLHRPYAVLPHGKPTTEKFPNPETASPGRRGDRYPVMPAEPAAGRGGGVGRPLGVIPGLGVSVGLAVGVAVTVAVAVGVGVDGW